MSAAFGIVFVSIDDEEKARQIARTLVEERLAACVQISPIFSRPAWLQQLPVGFCGLQRMKLLVSTLICFSKASKSMAAWKAGCVPGMW